MKRSAISKLRILYRRFQRSNSPQFNLVWGFFLYTIAGFVLLALPFFHKTDVSFIDSLFISTSAVSTTGLVTIGVESSFNLGGQLVILLLFQVGGIGYMTLTTYYLLFTTNRISSWHQRLIGTEFTMPETIQIKDFIRSVILYTIVMEVLGTIAFYVAFSDTGMDGGQAFWYAVFHSVSAFCTAGFALFGDSFESFTDAPGVNAIIAVLAIAGSLGFIVATDIWYRISGRSSRLSFTTKIVVWGSFLLLLMGTLLFYFSDPDGGDGMDTLLSAFFQSMTAMTTVGFNTVPIGDLVLPTLLFMTFLMYVGASPSGTAGGLKITTLTAMVAVLKSRLFGQKRVSFFNHLIPFERLYVATSTFMLYTSLIFLFTFLMSYSEPFRFEQILFEVASALGTVGLSTGITGDLSTTGKWLIIVIMFVGRVGVLTFGFALLARAKKDDEVLSEEGDLAV